MATPTTFTPFVSTPALVAASATTYYTGGANGGVIDYILLCNTDTASHTVTVYAIPSGGTATATNTIANSIVIPADGVPVNVLNVLVARPYHYGASEFIQAVADAASKVSIRIGGTDYA